MAEAWAWLSGAEPSPFWLMALVWLATGAWLAVKVLRP